MRVHDIRKELYENMVACVNEYENNGCTSDFVLRKHKRFINKNNIQGKSRYKTLMIMQNYFNCPYSRMAQQVFTSTLNNTTIQDLVHLYVPNIDT